MKRGLPSQEEMEMGWEHEGEIEKDRDRDMQMDRNPGAAKKLRDIGTLVHLTCSDDTLTEMLRSMHMACPDPFSEKGLELYVRGFDALEIASTVMPVPVPPAIFSLTDSSPPSTGLVAIQDPQHTVFM